ncbi:metal-dependent hydrolase family protein [Thalassobacillus hwangdonensis]|uniref:Amidohydrolase family protein n=1 Tax=Thalassobacillus hwangdonensis TaxID=546108 RepID=A0ABW3KVJ8_9BACI
MGQATLLRNAHVIDGTGQHFENASVLLHDGKIEAVGSIPDSALPSGTNGVDCTGKTVIPGLIDAHMHFLGTKSLNLMLGAFEPPEMRMGRALKNLDKLLNAGFTAVRDVGSTTAVHIRNLIEEGLYTGPTIKTSNLMLSQTAGHGDLHMLPKEFNLFHVCDGADECRKAAREQFRAGADFIKVSSSGGVLSEKDDPRAPQFTVEELEAIVYEAEAVGSYVASHAQSAQGIKNALKAGVRTIEHGILIDDEGIELMLVNGAYLVPTLSIVKRIVEYGHLHGVPDFGLKKAHHFYEIHKENIRKAYKAGVPIAAATDFAGCDPVDHGGNAEELSIFVHDIGMSEMDTIVSATKVAAQSMAIEETTGTLETGKQADVLVVNGNPLENIDVLKNTAAIEQVYVKGEQVKNTLNVLQQV